MSRIAYITQPGLHVLALQRALKQSPCVGLEHFPRTAPALESIIGADYALVVIDVHTPAGCSSAYSLCAKVAPIRDGLPLAQRLQANMVAISHIHQQQVPIVATGLYDCRSRYGGKRLSEYLREAGVREYVKYHSAERLAQRLRRHLHGVLT